MPLKNFETVYKVNGSKGYLFIQRCFDIVASICGLSVLLIPMAFVALMISIESPGPAFYSQERVGKNGKTFMIYKFRSMYNNAEEKGPQWAEMHDDRVTKLGRVLRRWHIDELPQLFNVLKGDMSVVGPRPEREYFYKEFEKDVPDFRARLMVQQGLTGLAQVNGGYDVTPDVKFAYDVEYMAKQSVMTDLKCILKTFVVIFTHKGAR